MLKSKMLIDGGADSLVATSLLEAINVVVLKVVPRSVLQGPLQNAATSDMTPRLYCGLEECPREML
ncbi:hypothetical protein C5167_049011 [Papaver somniferum]|uniref:Uncharacterized protein n=1 Tax=Papaver somniferum TaxID=3469 RepID=A0A4Y7KJK9_PAPSO|nr:hypothetical protein C5167_049011 [Papaver somniferum]